MSLQLSQLHSSKKETSANGLCEILGVEKLDVEWLAGDGSDRSYYRLKPNGAEQTYVLMKLCGADAEALKDGRYDWIAIQKLLTANKVSTPLCIRECPELQSIIIEDYGNLTFETCIKNQLNKTKKFYEQAAELLVSFLKIPQSNHVWTSRSFDQERLSWELDFFNKHFIQGVLDLNFDAKKTQRFTEDNASLSSYLAPLSKYFCHRDFHSRNIMVKDEKLAVIDFQDARLGAAAYDLVSLCFDAYVPLSVDQRLETLEEILKVVEKKVSSDVASEIRQSWPAVFLQRQLKAIGSFGYLANVKNKPMYLSYAPKALTLLQALPVYDNRWPFMSGELLKILQDKVLKKSS